MRFCICPAADVVRTSTANRKRTPSCLGMTLLTLGVLAVAAQPAAAQRFVGVIDTPAGTDMYGGTGMCLNPNTGRLYIPNNATGHVLVADTLTDTVLYDLPAYSAHATLYEPVSNRIYVTDYTGILVFDADDDTYLRTLSSPEAPFGFGWGLDVDPGTGRIYTAWGDRLYVVDANAAAGDDALIDVVDLAAVAVYNTWSVVVNPNTNTVYVADSVDSVVVVDGATNEIVAVLKYEATGYLPSIAIDVELNRIYLPAINEVLVIDGDSNAISKRIAHSGGGMGIAVDAVTHRVYVAYDFQGAGAYNQFDAHANEHANGHAYNINGVTSMPEQLLVINGPTGSVAGVRKMNYCQGIAVNPLTGRVYLFDRSGTDSNGDVFVFQDVSP